MRPQPPYLSRKALHWFCSKELVEEIEGDLQEQFADNYEALGLLRASWIYTWTVCRSIRPYLIRKSQNRNRLNTITMLTSYLKTARRSLSRQKAYTLTNIIGLSTGIISVFLILSYVKVESSYDQHHHDHNRIFRVVTEVNIKGDRMHLASTPPGLARRLLADYPAIEATVRVGSFLGIDKNLLKVDNKQLFEENGYLADSSLFELLTFNFIHGDRYTALNGSQKIVLSAALSENLFGDINPVSQTLTITNNYGSSEYEISGVYEDKDTRSHFSPAFICSMNSGSIGRFMANSDEIAGNNFLYTYIKLKEQTQIEDIKKQIPSFISRHIGDALAESGVEKTHHFQNVADIHLHSDLRNEAGATSNIKYIYMLLSIAVFILIIACVNFINLATAQSSHRVREIGVRKTLGALKASLVYQFLTEAALLTLISIIVAVAGIYFFLPNFNNLTGTTLTTAVLTSWSQIGLLVAIAVITSLLAGAYPAFYLSSINATATAKSKSRSQTSGWLRKGLVTFQFAIAIVLMIGSLVIVRQLEYMSNKPLGFDMSRQLVIPLQSAEGIRAFPTLRDRIEGLAGITSVAGITYAPSENVLSDNLYYAEGGTSEEGIRIQQNDIDFGVIEALGIAVLNGTTFRPDMPDLGTSAVLNETAVKSLGYETATAVGRKIYTTEDSLVEMTIIGVVKDFHFSSLHRPIESYMFAMRPGRGITTMIVQAESSDVFSIIENVQTAWNAIIPDIPFEYNLLSDQVSYLYNDDRNFSKVITTFAGMAIIICCLGLLGLAAFTAEQRTREIGIRKVLGASPSSMLIMLNKQFTGLVLLAFVIAAPIGWYLMTQWLQGFAFKIEMGITVLAPSLLATMIITALVVSFQSLKAALTNPVKTLRNE